MKGFLLATIIIITIISMSINSVAAQNPAFPGYDQRFRPLIGGVEINLHSGFIVRPCSIGVPVTYEERFLWWSYRVDGLISAGHCGDVGNPVYQPYFDFWQLDSNYIGGVRRDSVPRLPTQGETIVVDVDALLINARGAPRLPPPGISPHIFERGKPSYLPDRDINEKVGILGYREPILKTIVYKSGRTTGVTYGEITDINPKWAIVPPGGGIIWVLYSFEVVRPSWIRDPIALGGDSGSPVYYRAVYYREPIGAVHYSASIVGILWASDGIGFYASIFSAILRKWPDVQLLTCSGYGCL